MAEQPVDVFRAPSGFAAGSRCLDGHFPGNPIVPGAMILAYLASRLDATGRVLERVERVKFQRVLLPDVPFEVRLTASGAGAGRAEFRDEAGVFATARVVIRAGHG